MDWNFRRINEVGLTRSVVKFGNLEDKPNLIDIEAVLTEFEDGKERLGILIYGKCTAGDKCNDVHGVLIQPNIYFYLHKKLTDEMDERLTDSLLKDVLDLDDGTHPW